jgi:hypothetical protein
MRGGLRGSPIAGRACFTAAVHRHGREDHQLPAGRVSPSGGTETELAKRDAVKRPFVSGSASKCLLYSASYGINIYVARDFYVSFPFG